MTRVLVFLALLFAAATAQAQEFPALNGRVVDAADLLDAATEADLTARLAALETSTGRQLVVATLPSLQDYPIEDYGYRLGRAWGIGTEANDDGALLIVAPEERQVRIEVGYGLEPILTDALSSVIVNSAILPRFREGDMAGGIVAGVEGILAVISLPEDEARARSQQIVAEAERQEESGGGWGVMIFWIIVLLFTVVPMFFGRRRGRRYRRGLGPVMIWGPGLGGGWGGRGGGGGGGFGGFSGGGGSFGGGGASGGW